MSITSDNRNRVQERFETIYAQNLWGNGSGEGSLPIHNEGYANFLQKFIRFNDVKSVVDFGCGDWQFSRFIDWNGAHYHGFDIVRSVIEANRKTYARDGIEFDVSSKFFDDLPSADLLIVKDVLQHWSNDAIERFLPTLKRYRFALLTNCTGPRRRRFWQSATDVNADIEDGGFRYLDLRRAPFSLSAKAVYAYSPNRPWHRRFPFVSEAWHKTVLLVDNG